MGVYLAITDGTTTVDLSADYIDYSPMAGSPDDEWVTERLTARFDQGVAGWRTDIQNIGNLFTQAKKWQRKRTGARVYINLRWATGDDLYRSEIASGLILPDRNALSRPMANAATPTYGIFEIELTRRNYWEDDTERSLYVQGFNVTGGTQQIYNSYRVTDVTGEAVGTAGAGTVYAGTFLNTPVEAFANPPEIFYSWNSAARTATVTAGTAATSGGVIAGSGIASGTINYTNGVWGITFSSAPAGTFTADYRYGYGNYIDIPGTAVSGDLPAPLKLTYYARYANMYIGATYGSAVGFTNTYEAEAYGTVVNGTATASGGSYISWASSTVEANLFNLALNNVYLAGNEYYIPIFFQNIGTSFGGTNTYWRNTFLMGGSFIYTSEQVRFTNTLGINKMPPVTFHNMEYLDPDGTVTYALYQPRIQKIDDAGSPSIYVDFIQFMPTAGGYTETFPVNYASGSVTVVDGINERVYHYTPASYNYYDSFADYGWVSAYPGQNNRVYTLVNLTAPLTATLVSVAYRPRRRVI